MRRVKQQLHQFLAALTLAACCTFLPLTIKAQLGGTTRYVYDDNGRLHAVIAPNGEANVYEYDAAGNITAIRRNTASTLEVLGFDPREGLVGTEVTIFGTGFNPTVNQNTVKFNGVTAAVSTASNNALVVTVPVGATTGPITVMTPAGSTVSNQSFVVIMPPVITNFTPTIGTVGTPVTITGANFVTTAADNVVTFNLAQAAVSSATETTLATSVPAGATSGHISVTTPVGAVVSSGDFFVPPAGFTAADVEYADRITFGPNKVVTIQTPNKIALLVFDGIAGQHISLGLSSWTFTPNCPATVTIFKPDGASLVTEGCPDANALNADLPVTGTYTILFAPSQARTGSVTLTLSQDLADTLTIGGPSVNVMINRPGQRARLTFSGTAGQRVSLLLAATLPSCCHDVFIFNPDGTTLASTSINGGTGFIDTRTLPFSGLYTILVDPGGVATGNVTLTLYGVPSDDTGPITIGGPSVAVTLTTPGQNARLTFSGTAGQRVSLGLSNITIPDCASTVTVFKPDGTTLASKGCIRSFAAAGDALDLDPLPVTGSYTILFDPDRDFIGNVTLTLSEEATGALVIGGPNLNLTISRPGQRARFTFTGAIGQRLSLGLSNITFPDCATEITVYKPDGTPLTNRGCLRTIFGAGDAVDFDPLPVTGNYAILFNSERDYLGSLTLTLSEELTGPITIGGPNINLTISRPGQRARFTFNGTAGQRLSLGVSNITFPDCFADVTVIKPDGMTLTNRICIRNVFGDGDAVDFDPLPVTGTYTILFNPDRDYIGSLTLTLSEELSDTLTIGGPSVNLMFARPGQRARLTFSGVTGQYVSVGMTGITFPDCAGEVIIFKPDGASLVSRSCLRLPAETLDADLTVTGTYTILYDPSNAQTGNVTLTLSEDVSGTLSVGGPPANIVINRPGQNARFTLTGSASQPITVRVTGNTIICVNVILLRPDGTPLISSNGCDSSFNLNTQILPVTGTYTIKVDPNGVNTGSLNLSVTSP